MTWEKTPWFVGNGAEHTPELARLVLFSATTGTEGVIGATDLKVTQTPTASSTVNIAAGAALLLNRSAGGGQQTYAARNPTTDTVTIAATTSSGGRSDLVIARVEDPQYSPWVAPADPVNAQYIFTRVIQNVPAGTTTAKELNLGYPAIALARIDIPVSTSAITTAMIKDMRKMAQPRRVRSSFIVLPTSSSNFTTTLADVMNFGSISVPDWATQMVLRGDIAGAVLRTATSNAEMRVRLGTTYTQVAAVTEEANRRTNMLSAGKIAVPSAIRGTSQVMAIQARKSDAGTGVWSVDTYSTGVIDIEFMEEAE